MWSRGRTRLRHCVGRGRGRHHPWRGPARRPASQQSAWQDSGRFAPESCISAGFQVRNVEKEPFQSENRARSGPIFAKEAPASHEGEPPCARTVHTCYAVEGNYKPLRGFSRITGTRRKPRTTLPFVPLRSNRPAISEAVPDGVSSCCGCAGGRRRG